MTTDQWELAGKLLDSTRAGQLKWQPTADEQTFQVSVGGYVVRVRQRTSFTDPAEVIDVELVDADGDVVDEFSSDETDVLKDRAALQELYSTVRRQARGAHDAIESILRELNRAAV